MNDVMLELKLNIATDCLPACLRAAAAAACWLCQSLLFVCYSRIISRSHSQILLLCATVSVAYKIYLLVIYFSPRLGNAKGATGQRPNCGEDTLQSLIEAMTVKLIISCAELYVRV